MWSFGVVLWELASRQEPFKDMSDWQVPVGCDGIRSAGGLFIASAALAGYIYAAFSADSKAGHGQTQSWGRCAAAHRSEGIIYMHYM